MVSRRQAPLCQSLPLVTGQVWSLQHGKVFNTVCVLFTEIKKFQFFLERVVTRGYLAASGSTLIFNSTVPERTPV